jgi:hypothetical protein
MAAKTLTDRVTKLLQMETDNVLQALENQHNSGCTDIRWYSGGVPERPEPSRNIGLSTAGVVKLLMKKMSLLLYKVVVSYWAAAIFQQRANKAIMRISSAYR